MHAGMGFFSCLTVSSREMAIRRDDKLLLEMKEGLFFNLDEKSRSFSFSPPTKNKGFKQIE